MNDARRKVIAAAKADLETARDEEQEALDNMPYGIQISEKGEEVQGNVDSLEEAIGALENIQ